MDNCMKIKPYCRLDGHMAFEVIKYVDLGIYDHELDNPPYEVIFRGSISDCLAYINAYEDGLLDYSKNSK